MKNRPSGFMRSPLKYLACIVILFFTPIMTGSQVFAHKVNVFAYIEGNSIIIQGYFSGKAKSQNSLVEVFDQNGKKLLEGRTDVKGVWSFGVDSIPTGVKSLKIVLEAEPGHRGEYTLDFSEAPASSGKQSSENPALPNTPSGSVPSVVPTVGAEPGINQEALLHSLSLMMDQKIEPLIKTIGNQERLLLEQQAGAPKMTEIIGGIGWILGLAGITAFFWGKNKQSS